MAKERKIITIIKTKGEPDQVTISHRPRRSAPEIPALFEPEPMLPERNRKLKMTPAFSPKLRRTKRMEIKM